jgi:hypothetical protein
MKRLAIGIALGFGGPGTGDLRNAARRPGPARIRGVSHEGIDTKHAEASLQTALSRTVS